MAEKNTIAIIGNEDVVMGFKALSLKTYSVKGKEECEKALSEAVKESVAVCLVQEEMYSMAKSAIEGYRSLPLPVFLPFSKTKKAEVLDEIVKGIRLRATGVL